MRVSAPVVFQPTRAERAVALELECYPHLHKILLEGGGGQEVPPLV